MVVGIRLLFIMFLSTAALAQGSASFALKGKVNADEFNVDGIYVINLTTEKAVITDYEGYFGIDGRAGDTLLLSAVQYKSRRVVLTSEDFENRLFFVKMEPTMNQLDEVVIRRYNNINAVSSGVISANQKSYTPAERKLKTATGLNGSAAVGSMAGGAISADPLINFLSGRTAVLKKELKVEKKEFYLRELDAMFDRSHFVDKLKIPSDYVKGFQYYAVDNDKFTKILNEKNITTTEFLLGELAIKYEEIIARENK
jgi:hypothetical protein